MRIISRVQIRHQEAGIRRIRMRCVSPGFIGPGIAPPAYGSAVVGAKPKFGSTGLTQKVDGGSVPTITRTFAAAAVLIICVSEASTSGADLQSAVLISTAPR